MQTYLFLAHGILTQGILRATISDLFNEQGSTLPQKWQAGSDVIRCAKEEFPAVELA
jgi:hypothetical protein